MGEALLRAGAERAGLPVVVSSAGFLFDGRPASDTTVQVAAERGLDLSAHRSRIVDDPIVGGADVVLTMERRHARDLALEHACGARVHTLKSFAELVSRRQFAAGRAGAPDAVAGMHELVAAAHEMRPAAALLGDERPDEVSDPHGRSARVHRRTLDELTGAVDAIVAALSDAQERAQR